jgi:VWFA-related protein
MLHWIKQLILPIVIFPVLMQIFRPSRTNPPIDTGSDAPQLASLASPYKVAANERQQSDVQIAVDAPLVLLDVLVTDEDGNVLSGLQKGNFRLTDDGKPQVITTFGPTEDPITIVILLEYSAFAYDYFAYKGAYWSSGFLNYLDPKDWVALVTYDMRPTIRVDFTRNRAEVQDTLSSLAFPGFAEANLFDALIDTLDKLDRVKGKKAVLIITTGMNTFSQATLDDTLDRIKKSSATIFCIGLAESEYLAAEMRSGGSAIGYLQAKNQLQTYADLTGGMAWFPRFEGEMPSLFRSVVGFLRSEYDIGFTPAKEALDGRYHKLKVEVVGPDGKPLRVTDAKGRRRKIEVFARDGYVATPEPLRN